MRLRHIPGSEEMIASSPYMIQEPEQYKGNWNCFFHNDHPLEIEIGMGKGRFIMELAQLHPEVNYIGIERYPSVLLRGLKKRQEIHLDNLYFICADARTLADIYASYEVRRIYLNFSDPWPKERHAKRRLTSPYFLDIYDKILKPDGSLELKTDNQGLFDYSLETLSAAGWQVDAQTRNLHADSMAQDNVLTEYEAKFSGQGKDICKLIASRPASKSNTLPQDEYFVSNYAQ